MDLFVLKHPDFSPLMKYWTLKNQSFCIDKSKLHKERTTIILEDQNDIIPNENYIYNPWWIKQGFGNQKIYAKDFEYDPKSKWFKIIDNVCGRWIVKIHKNSPVGSFDEYRVIIHDR